MSLVLSPGLDTVLALVSATQAALGSLVIMGMVRPRPGSVTLRARRMTAEASVVFWRISWETSLGSVMLLRLVSVPVGI